MKTGRCALRIVLLVLASNAAAALAADVPRLGSHPNLNGIWQAMNSANWNLEAHSAQKIDSQWQLGALFAIPAGKSVVASGTIPYLPEALKQRDEFRAQWPKSDPETLCYLPGIPRATYMPYPFQIVQGDRDILMVYSYATSNRTIHMGKHEEPPVDSWMGRSEGHWEGNTLVVDTTNFSDEYSFRGSDRNLHLTERFTRTSPDSLLYEFTVDDATAFTKPWTAQIAVTRAKGQIYEYACHEGNYAMVDILAGARKAEQNAGEKKVSK